jgi:hypothetical protein
VLKFIYARVSGNSMRQQFSPTLRKAARTVCTGDAQQLVNELLGSESSRRLDMAHDCCDIMENQGYKMTYHLHLIPLQSGLEHMLQSQSNPYLLHDLLTVKLICLEGPIIHLQQFACMDKLDVLDGGEQESKLEPVVVIVCVLVLMMTWLVVGLILG